MFALRSIALSSGVSAALTWVTLVMAARRLGPGPYAEFMVVWAIFFALTSLLAGLQQEITRAGSHRPGASEPGTPMLRGIALIALAGVALIAGGSPLWGPDLLGDGWVPIIVSVTVAFAAYVLANYVTGALAADRQWMLYSSSILLEGIFRFLAVVVVLTAGPTQTRLTVAIACGFAAWVVLLALSPRARDTLTLRTFDSTRGLLAGASHSMFAAACSAALVSGFPALLKLTDGSAYGPVAGVVVSVVVTTRAPLLLLNSYQGPILARFVDHRPGQGSGPATRRGRVVVVATLVLLLVLALAATIGPSALSLIYGEAYLAPRWLVAVLTFDALLLAILTITGWRRLAAAQHSVFALGWAVAVVLTIAVLLVPVDVELRASVSLLVGPIGGILTHSLARNGAPPSIRRDRLGASSQEG